MSIASKSVVPSGTILDVPAGNHTVGRNRMENCSPLHHGPENRTL